MYRIHGGLFLLHQEATMTTPIIPTLMGDINKLQNPVDIIKYILRWYMYVPKNINDTFNEQEISFRYTDASIGHNKELIGSSVRIDIETAIKRYFPTGIINITVETSDVDEVRYNLSINIVIIVDNKTYSIQSEFQVDNDGYLVYDFSGD